MYKSSIPLSFKSAMKLMPCERASIGAAKLLISCRILRNRPQSCRQVFDLVQEAHIMLATQLLGNEHHGSENDYTINSPTIVDV